MDFFNIGDNNFCGFRFTHKHKLCQLDVMFASFAAVFHEKLLQTFPDETFRKQ